MTFTFAEYDRSAGVPLMERTGRTVEIEADTMTDAAESIRSSFPSERAEARIRLDGNGIQTASIYPCGIDCSEFCWLSA